MIEEVLLSCFGMKIGPGWGVVACNVGAQCQNLNWISAQTTGVVQLTPNFVDHLVMLIKHDLHKKNHISRTFAQLTPSDTILYYVNQLVPTNLHAQAKIRRFYCKDSC